jgi:hypothetical protein
MMFGETVAAYCENHTEHIKTLRGQIVGDFNDNAGGKFR